MKEALGAINWDAAWLEETRTVGMGLAQRAINAAVGTRLCDVLNSAENSPVRFVAQSELPVGQAYEQFIFSTAKVPTRDNLHDFFNALAWLHFPRSKQRLNQLHVAHIAQTGSAPVRGAARDGLTLFDENAALLRAPDALWDALAAKDWRRVFGDLRPLWASSCLVLFGHALQEKLVYPRKQITAHVCRAYQATNSIADMDAWLAADLSAERLAAKPFAHLPVLGVPGWWAGNEEPGFYDDPGVFRAAK